MAAVFLPDEIVLNILARLPAKPLLRFRCVSKYWHCMLREPYFMKLRSRKTIIVPVFKTLYFIDDEVPTDNNGHSIFKRCNPLENLRGEFAHALIIGVFDGIVLLAYLQVIVLYNPFTGESKKLPRPTYCRRNGYGFGYGATRDDLKIVRFRQPGDICDVYDFKKNSWSSWSTKKYHINRNEFEHPVGTFLNGLLYWVKYKRKVLVVLSVKDMVLSEMHVPDYMKYFGDLATINGCLCSVKLHFSTLSSRVELWVMKEQFVNNSWMNTHSITLGLENIRNGGCSPLSILDNGRILMVNYLQQLVIYDSLKGSYKRFKLSVGERSFSFLGSSFRLQFVEYIESLVSPSELCFSRGKKKGKNKKGI